MHTYLHALIYAPLVIFFAAVTDWGLKDWQTWTFIALVVATDLAASVNERYIIRKQLLEAQEHIHD